MSVKVEDLIPEVAAVAQRCLNALVTMGIPHAVTSTLRTLAEQRLGRLRSELDYGNIEEIIGSGIHEFIDGFQTRLNHVGEAIYEAFFALPPAHEFAPSDTPSQTQKQTQSQNLAPEMTA